MPYCSSVPSLPGSIIVRIGPHLNASAKPTSPGLGTGGKNNVIWPEVPERDERGQNSPQTEEMSPTQARPGQALVAGLGSGLNNLKPKPAQAKPKPWLSGQARPWASLATNESLFEGIRIATNAGRSRPTSACPQASSSPANSVLDSPFCCALLRASRLPRLPRAFAVPSVRAFNFPRKADTVPDSHPFDAATLAHGPAQLLVFELTSDAHAEYLPSYQRVRGSMNWAFFAEAFLGPPLSLHRAARTLSAAPATCTTSARAIIASSCSFMLDAIPLNALVNTVTLTLLVFSIPAPYPPRHQDNFFGRRCIPIALWALPDIGIMFTMFAGQSDEPTKHGHPERSIVKMDGYPTILLSCYCSRLLHAQFGAASEACCSMSSACDPSDLVIAVSLSRDDELAWLGDTFTRLADCNFDSMRSYLPFNIKIAICWLHLPFDRAHAVGRSTLQVRELRALLVEA
ncbi:hypothetical protein DFH06DRAFT_1123735 [Mycena polygramma]|nr:hypothetical protein DFH06DRAFT_1123735 [Mycena polygramma]